MSEGKRDQPSFPLPGSRVPASGMRITNFSERAGRREDEAPRRPKLPPRPGPLPQGGPVDPRTILNRDEPKKKG